MISCTQDSTLSPLLEATLLMTSANPRTWTGTHTDLVHITCSVTLGEPFTLSEPQSPRDKDGDKMNPEYLLAKRYILWMGKLGHKKRSDCYKIQFLRSFQLCCQSAMKALPPSHPTDFSPDQREPSHLHSSINGYFAQPHSNGGLRERKSLVEGDQS